MVASAISQLTREERVQTFGIDCPDELVWHDWKPGHEQVKNLTLQNVSLVTQKLRVNLPSTQEFDMPYPTVFKLSPGMFKKIPIAFRPVKYSDNGYVDTVKISTKGGDFIIVVHAAVKETAALIPPFFNFGMCPVPETETTLFKVYNTGNYPLSFVWDADVPPFAVQPIRGKIPVGKSHNCKLSFTPKAASVYDAIIFLSCTGEGGNEGITKTYQMQVSGTGKVPYLQLLPSCPSTLHFGNVLPNNSKTLSVAVQNVTPVRAPFRVQLPEDSLGHASDKSWPRAAQLPFSVSPVEGVLDPNTAMELTFKFHSWTVGETACQRFDVVSGGLTSLSITCSGHCKSKRLILSTNSANFGEVEVGRSCSYVVKLTNDADEGVQFYFVNQGGFVTLDRDHGVVPPNSFICITAYFTPLLPLNYYTCLYCICRESDAPQPLHILGTAYTSKQRPAYLRQFHIDAYRRKFQKEEEEPSFLDLGGRAWHQIQVSPSILDFSSAPSDRISVMVTNTTNRKVTCAWMVAGESFEPCAGHDKPCSAQVYPLQADIRAKSRAEFQVSFKTLRTYAYEGLLLQAIVYEKINRNFRLVEADKLVPPWCVNVQILGHSMSQSRKHEPQVSISDDFIRFKPVVRGGRSYHVCNLSNHGDNSASYTLLPPVGPDAVVLCPFSILGPSCGLIKPHHFHNVVIQFQPHEAKNRVPYRARIPVVFNFDQDNPKFINAVGRCWDPSLHISDLNFPQTCLGASSSLICDLKNMSEIPVTYKLTVPKKFTKIFTLPQPEGQLLPLQASKVMATFTPQQEGFAGTALFAELESSGAKREMAVQMVGCAKVPVLKLEPSEVDFGAVEAMRTTPARIVIINTSDMMVMWRVEWSFVGSTDGDIDCVKAYEALKFEQTEGQVAGRCTETLALLLHPPARGLYEYDVKIIPVLEAVCIPLRIRAEVVYPTVQIVDVRTDSVNPQPMSLLWNLFRVDELNKMYSDDLTPIDRAYQKATGFDEKRRVQKQLPSFQLSLGTAALGSSPTISYVAMTNRGKLPVHFTFETPKSMDLKEKPMWSNDIPIEGEEHYLWVEEHNIYQISPMKATIEPGSFVHICITYHHYSIGVHMLPVVLNIINGKSILFYFKGTSLPPNLGKLSIRSSNIKLQPVSIGSEKGPVQVVELWNSGAVSAPWRVNTDTIDRLNTENFDFEVLSVYPQSGVLNAQSSCYLHFACTPLEAKNYKCPIQIEMLSNGEPVEDLTFDIDYDAYDPRENEPPPISLFPNLPIQTYAPVPGCGCALSVEELNFGRDIKIPCVVERVTILVNYTDDYILNFTWTTKELIDGLTIEPMRGELGPGSHLVVVLQLETSEPIDVSGEVECSIAWTHVSNSFDRNSTHSREVNASRDEKTENLALENADEEIFAFHKDHVHEPAYSSNPLLCPAHVSVVNRLTVTRFRSLMSNPAGQKYLSNNLHRTVWVSSHLPSQPQNHDEEIAQKISAPTTAPLFLRVIARAPAWVPPPPPRQPPLLFSPHPGQDNPYYSKFKIPDGSDDGVPMEVPFHVMENAMNDTLGKIVNDEAMLDHVDSLVRQGTPFFTQFHSSGTIAHPEEVEARRAEILAEREKHRVADEDDECEKDAARKDIKQADWVSSVLMDFQGAVKRRRKQDDSSSEDEDDVAADAVATVPPPISPERSVRVEKEECPDQVWDQLAKDAGEIDLDDFQCVAGETLSNLVLQSIGEVISGKVEWKR